MKRFSELAEKIKPEAIEIYKTLHENPELGFQEKWTTEFIAKKLTSFGIEVTTWDDMTGAVGLLKGGKPGPCVALRADIDGLPMQEENDLPYSSKRPGLMHSCGHDAHTTALLVAAKMLSECRDELQGSVKFIFQPAEELLTGAKTFIARGVLTNPEPAFIYGMHTMPYAPTGSLVLGAGPTMASVAYTTLEVKGVGSHGATPHKGKDSIVAAAAILTALQTVVSRHVPPLEPVVVSFGSIHAGATYNILPEKVEMKGTVRAFNPEVYDSVEKQMGLIIQSTAEAYGATTEFTFDRVVPTVSNSEELTTWAKGSLAKVAGEKNVLPVEPMMGGEDFALYMEKVPGVFAFFGTGNEAKKTTAPWHHPAFNVDFDALPVGAAAYAQIAYDWLNR